MRLQHAQAQAQDRNTDPSVLDDLAGSDDLGATCNPSAPTRVIGALVTDADPEVRAAAVEHPNAPKSARAAAGLVAN